MQNKHFFCLTSFCLHIVIVNTLYLVRARAQIGKHSVLSIG